MVVLNQRGANATVQSNYGGTPLTHAPAAASPSPYPGARQVYRFQATGLLVNFGQHASGHRIHQGRTVLSVFHIGHSATSNTPIDPLTNKQKWVRISLPLSAFSDSEEFRERATIWYLLSSHRSHDFGIKATPTRACDVPGKGGVVLRAFRDHWDPQNRGLLTSQATKC
jgi:hypothetical protein